jgi:hypothetical protein
MEDRSWKLINVFILISYPLQSEILCLKSNLYSCLSFTTKV